MRNLREFSKKELAEIHYNLNSWKWDYRLGAKPENWDELPNWEPLNVLSKRLYILPIMDEILNIVGAKYLFKHFHLNKLNKSEREFEIWWLKRRLRVFFTGREI
ncbi:hypothetical protein DT075_14365 [Bacillus licheniformis]|nr:hypothetical protein DT075_14365 [Bacillus licheniformis]